MRVSINNKIKQKIQLKVITWSISVERVSKKAIKETKKTQPLRARLILIILSIGTVKIMEIWLWSCMDPLLLSILGDFISILV